MIGPVSRDSNPLDSALTDSVSSSSEATASLENFSRRFVVLRHDVGPEFVRTTSSHLDWMFETGDSLSTWSTDLVSTFDNSFDLPCAAIADHRLAYLNCEGDLGGGRGSVKQLLVGEYTRVEANLTGLLFKAVLRWQDRRGVCFARLEVDQRVLDSDCGLAESRSVCGLRFVVGR